LPKPKVTGAEAPDVYDRLDRSLHFYFGDPKKWPRNTSEIEVFLYYARQGLMQDLKAILHAAAKQKNVGGAPEKFPWEDLWFELIRQANHALDPLDRETLRERVEEFISQNWEEHPTDSQIRAKLRKLTQVLRR
jgi:hypothetical protein